MNETTEHRSWIMSRIRSTDTKPEMIVRRLTYALGYRYRLHDNKLPGKPDMVFAGRRKIIFIHGCFWHGHTDPSCKRARIPKTRLQYWEQKIKGNSERDAQAVNRLEEAGWRVLTLWECQLNNRGELERLLREFLG